MEEEGRCECGGRGGEECECGGRGRSVKVEGEGSVSVEGEGRCECGGRGGV